MKVTFDSNILIYAVDVDAKERHRIAADFLLRATRLECIQTLQSLSEFFNVITRKRGVSPRKALQFINDWREVFLVCTADEDTLSLAIRAVIEHKLAFWDAMLWSAARHAGCQLLLSEDLQDGRKLDGVTFVDPFNPKNKRIIDTIFPSSGV